MPAPSTFTQEIADTICERLADGESLRKICLDDHMPSKATVFRWLGENEAFQDQYTRAREAQAETLADEIIEIADDGMNDLDAEGNYDGDVVQRSRLRVEARKWVAAKLKPKKYGDKIDVTTGGDKIKPDLNDVEAAARLAAFAASMNTANTDAAD